MAFFSKIREAFSGVPQTEEELRLSDSARLREGGRKLNVPSGYNVRELGGYETPLGTTAYHRFLRCGGTRSLTGTDLAFFKRWGVRRVVDLRGMGESPNLTCAFSRQDWVSWKNVSLFDFDISAPQMVPDRDVDNYLVSSYLHMLARTEAIRAVFEFFAEVEPDECVLFHCAAGMDRTGMVGMLLMGLVEATFNQVVADYSYSFGTVKEVDWAVDHWNGAQPEDAVPFGLWSRVEAVATVYDTLLANYGSARNYLSSCGLSDASLDAVRDHLLGAN